MASSFFALFDDISTLLDDISLLTKVAAQKTAGVVGDDLALNAQQLAGIAAQRELPVVWAVAKGSFWNKAILVPLALALSVFLPWAIAPLLMLGGAYLCLEGFEKIVHSLLPSGAEEDLQDSAALMQQDRSAWERNKVRGAVRTDFVLSAEIIVLTLGTVQGVDWTTQLTVLAVVGLLMTVGVYGLVACIVKLDDVGLYWSQRADAGHGWVFGQRVVGRVLLRSAPWLMRTLAVVGTAAMFLVGGGILLHALPGVHIDGVITGLLAELMAGVLAGGAVYAGVACLHRLLRNWRSPKG